MRFFKMIFFCIGLSLFLSACASENEETVTKEQTENKTENKTEEKKQPEEKTEENTKSVKLDIPNQESYKKLSALLSNQNDPSLDPEDYHKVMTEQKDIRTFIDKMDKIEVKKNNDAAELLDYSMATLEETTYFFELFKDENNKFSVFFFEDGQVMLVKTDLSNKSKEDQEKTYISIAKHPELLQELKDSLSINF